MSKFLVITANTISGLGLLLWPFVSYMAIFAWDNPPFKGSWRANLLETATLTIFWYPLIFGIALVGSIVLFKLKHRGFGAFVSFMPIFAVFGALMMFAVSGIR